MSHFVSHGVVSGLFRTVLVFWQVTEWLPYLPPLGISFVGVGTGTSALQPYLRASPFLELLGGSGCNLLLLVSFLACSSCCM